MGEPRLELRELFDMEGSLKRQAGDLRTAQDMSGGGTELGTPGMQGHAVGSGLRLMCASTRNKVVGRVENQPSHQPLASGKIDTARGL